MCFSSFQQFCCRNKLNCFSIVSYRIENGSILDFFSLPFTNADFFLSDVDKRRKKSNANGVHTLNFFLVFFFCFFLASDELNSFSFDSIVFLPPHLLSRWRSFYGFKNIILFLNPLHVHKQSITDSEGTIECCVIMRAKITKSMQCNENINK